MALNEVLERAQFVAVTVPIGTVSGDPVVVGGIVGVAQIDRQADGTATINRAGMHALPVAATGAMAEGDEVFIDNDGVLSDTNTGTHFGWIGPGQAVEAGATTTVNVIVGW